MADVFTMTVSSLTPGKIVHYVMPDGAQPGAHRAAMILSVIDAAQGTVNLLLYPDTTLDGILYNVLGKQINSVLFSGIGNPVKANGTWHEIEGAEIG